MKIVIVGLGYVGITATACLTSQGHAVHGVDVNPEKAAQLNAGTSPIIEPLVPELLAAAVEGHLLSASTSVDSLGDTDLVIVCVGTPSGPDGSHNMSHIEATARELARVLAAESERRDPLTIAFRSTFRPGTMEELIAPIFTEALGGDWASRVELVYNPEYLRESTAVKDYLNPPKIVVGTAGAKSSATMTRLYEGMEAPLFETGYREAELTKFVDNTWHAVKVAFANEVGRVCAAYGVDAEVAHSLFVADTVLNISPYYTRPGGAFGGSCLPKDVRAMQHLASSADAGATLIGSLLTTNQAHKDFQVGRVLAAAPEPSRILVVGLAFKAGTDDLRESPHVDLVARLIAAGHDVRVYDPSVSGSDLVGQNVPAVLGELPTLREILVDRSAAEDEAFDLMVINQNVDGVPSNRTSPKTLDLRKVA